MCPAAVCVRPVLLVVPPAPRRHQSGTCCAFAEWVVTQWCVTNCGCTLAKYVKLALLRPVVPLLVKLVIQASSKRPKSRIHVSCVTRGTSRVAQERQRVSPALMAPLRCYRDRRGVMCAAQDSSVIKQQQQSAHHATLVSIRTVTTARYACHVIQDSMLCPVALAPVSRAIKEPLSTSVEPPSATAVPRASCSPPAERPFACPATLGNFRQLMDRLNV